MTLTEKEACNKECPYKFSRDPERNTSFCVASECVAWRWRLNPSGHFDLKQIAPTETCAECHGTGSSDGGKSACFFCNGDGTIGHFERTGYCGLAGKPES